MLGVEGKVNLPAPESNINADEDPGPLEPPEIHVVVEAVRQQLGPLANQLSIAFFSHYISTQLLHGPPAVFLRGEAIRVAMTALSFSMSAP
jgi:hypothetical protein